MLFTSTQYWEVGVKAVSMINITTEVMARCERRREREVGDVAGSGVGVGGGEVGWGGGGGQREEL